LDAEIIGTGLPQDASARQHERPRLAGRIASTSRALHRFLTADRPVFALLIGSLVFGTGYCLCLFEIRFLTGTSEFWISSRGIRGILGIDIATALSGYYFFVTDTWQIPLFHVSKLGFPDGTNIIYTDSIPLLALFGRIIYRVTGETVNLFGVWTAACYVLTATALTQLVATLGQKNIVATAAATIIGLSIPPLLWRWGHLSLMAHFEILLALVFYFGCKRRCSPLSCFAAAVFLTAMALTTHPYIFLMVEGIVAATVAQALIDRALSISVGGCMILGLVAFMATMMALCGHLETSAISAGGFGFFSMNVLSPIMPQMSGLFPGMASFFLDATGGQYEGFNYLGAGILLLTAAVLIPPAHFSHAPIGWWYKGFRVGCTKHLCLLLVLCGFTALALSNFVIFGRSFMVEIPLPPGVLEIFGIFRSSGRLFWPVVYCIAAVGLVAVMARYRRTAPALLAAAAILQWIDTTPLRDAVAARAATPVPPVIEASAWRQAISLHSAVRVIPSYACLGSSWGWSHPMAIQLQLLAAMEDVAVNTVYAGRGRADCGAESQAIGDSLANPGELDIFLPEAAAFAAARKVAAQGDGPCRSSSRFVVCSNQLPFLDARSLLTVNPVDQ
jgi:hypothetical protein